jgi:hypothetical protein|tara:strand:- start:3613 stop:3762 length:150 start_codon:yes stop_codon:yes gene_type:complete
LPEIGEVVYSDYRKAKFPKATPEEVEAPELSQEVVDTLLAEAEKWLSEG